MCEEIQKRLILKHTVRIITNAIETVGWEKGVTRILRPSYVLSYTAARTGKHLASLVTMHQLSVLRRAVGYRHSVRTGHGTPQYLPTHKGSCVTRERLKQRRYLMNGVATVEVTW